MDQRNIQVSPRDFLQLLKVNISDKIKPLKDFVQQNSNIPGMRDAIMDCLQSLRRDLQDIESSVQYGELPISSNTSGTNQHHVQEITQQNVYFGPTLNQESDMLMGPNAQSLSSSKRKRWSKVWKHFTEDVNKDGKKCAKCNRCKKELLGSSKDGTTRLHNHLRSCRGLRNPSVVADKVEEKSLTGPDSNDFDFVRRIIKYGLNNIKDDILFVYEQEKCKSHGYIDKFPSRFSVTIEWSPSKRSWHIRIWFVDDSWELRNMIIFVAKCKDDYCTILKPLLVDWKIHRKICSMFIQDENAYEEVTKNLNNWFNEGGSLPFIGKMVSDHALLHEFDWDPNNYLKEIFPNSIAVKMHKIWNYTKIPSNDHNFERAVNQAQSMGKTVTSQDLLIFYYDDIKAYRWVMGYKEAFNELEHIDPDFKFINLTKEDWDDITLLCSGWQVLLECKKEIGKSTDSDHKTADVNFKVVRDIFPKFDQLRRSDNYYVCQVASLIKTRLAEYWKNSRLVLEIRVILDPRYKLEMVGDIYKMIYDYDSEIHLQKAIDDVTNIFNEYVKGMSSSSSSHDYNATSQSELDCYLRDEFPQDEMFDILQWWRDKSLVYPTLAKMARDFLSIPIKIL